MSKIRLYVENMDYGSFANDSKTQDAVIRNLEIIGEAVKRLSVEIKESNPDIPWKMIAATRDRLIHNYFGVNVDIIRGMSAIDLTELRGKIDKIRSGF
jgi:uncharacterized protein with HEPN domain